MARKKVTRSPKGLEAKGVNPAYKHPLDIPDEFLVAEIRKLCDKYDETYDWKNINRAIKKQEQLSSKIWALWKAVDVIRSAANGDRKKYIFDGEFYELDGEDVVIETATSKIPY